MTAEQLEQEQEIEVLRSQLTELRELHGSVTKMLAELTPSVPVEQHRDPVFVCRTLLGVIGSAAKHSTAVQAVEILKLLRDQPLWLERGLLFGDPATIERKPDEET